MNSLEIFNSDTDMGLGDHIYIVCSVTDRKSSLRWIAVLDELDDLLL